MHIEGLTRYWVSKGLFAGAGTLASARRALYSDWSTPTTAQLHCRATGTSASDLEFHIHAVDAASHNRIPHMSLWEDNSVCAAAWQELNPLSVHSAACGHLFPTCSEEMGAI